MYLQLTVNVVLGDVLARLGVLHGALFEKARLVGVHSERPVRALHDIAPEAPLQFAAPLLFAFGIARE
jgi:hypothetical protein